MVRMGTKFDGSERVANMVEPLLFDRDFFQVSSRESEVNA